MNLCKPAITIAALTAGAALGFTGGETARSDHFAALANFAGPGDACGL